MNGHIGFNEPGVSWNKNSLIADLDEVTQNVGQKYFSTQTHLTRGITLGLKQLLHAKTALLLANGFKKASIIKKALEEEMTENTPASIFQNHANGWVFLDRESSSGLSL
jgi:6-phosphogluconolactonase/glucosamine-6-phosphate isomerase/deaminase